VEEDHEEAKAEENQEDGEDVGTLAGEIYLRLTGKESEAECDDAGGAHGDEDGGYTVVESDAADKPRHGQGEDEEEDDVDRMFPSHTITAHQYYLNHEEDSQANPHGNEDLLGDISVKILTLVPNEMLHEEDGSHSNCELEAQDQIDLPDEATTYVRVGEAPVPNSDQIFVVTASTISHIHSDVVFLLRGRVCSTSRGVGRAWWGVLGRVCCLLGRWVGPSLRWVGRSLGRVGSSLGRVSTIAIVTRGWWVFA